MSEADLPTPAPATANSISASRHTSRSVASSEPSLALLLKTSARAGLAGKLGRGEKRRRSTAFKIRRVCSSGIPDSITSRSRQLRSTATYRRMALKRGGLSCQINRSWHTKIAGIFWKCVKASVVST